MLKEVFKCVIALISQPAKAWESLSEENTEDNEKYLTNYIYPLIGLVSIGAFLGVLFTRKEFDVELALKASVNSLVSALGGFFLGAYLLNELWFSVFKREKDIKLCQRFVGYSSALLFVLAVVLALLPEFFFLKIFVLYTVYIIWEGAAPYMQIKDDERMKFVGIASAVVLITPSVIEIILVMLMPGLRS
ncbi:Yip1 family protein [Massilibacteroides sp.]|uniref:Yip1 family protein n=1 Tax=Massilibacteroides sp. TaxID=2034766 RepID=UPI0026033D8B|nr:Yip1 family protein [Massilibacteroides sp.]MDD4515100.1 Yip1 family protein [Massilibacteroides sp.]